MKMPLPEHVRNEALAELAKCNRCGFCLTNCPTYNVTGVESEVARGRLALARAALDGELQASDLPDSVWSCILCRNCLPHCPPGVKMDRVMVAVRAALGEQLGVSPLRRAIIRGLLPKRGRLAAAATVGSLGQGLGLDRLLALWPDRRLRTAQRYAPRLTSPASVRRRIRAEGLYGGGKEAEVAVILGCATEMGLPRVTLALGYLLRELGITARLLDAACCGLPAYGSGDLDGAKLAARGVLQAAGDMPRLKALITPCVSCASYLEQYPELFADQPEAGRATALAALTKPASVFLAGAGLTRLLRQGGGGSLGRHTFHDPCHLAHYVGGKEQVREVLRALPGGEYVEMPGADSCCGAGGSFVITHPGHSDAVLERKVASIVATGAEVVTTACPGCLLQLKRGVQDLPGVRAQHLLEVAWDAVAAGR